MKVYRKIVIVLSVVIGIAVAILVNVFSPLAIASYTGSITEESYQILKDYAYEIASNVDVEEKEDIVVSKELTKEFLIINVDAPIYGIEAIFPLSNCSEKIENGIVKYEGVIDYSKVTYSEHTYVSPPLFYISVSILLAAVFACIPYAIFYHIPSGIIKLIKKH